MTSIREKRIKEYLPRTFYRISSLELSLEKLPVKVAQERFKQSPGFESTNIKG
ncbi:hypothetical protein CHS0354_022110, partial [Potamilus streckersoni]